ncbi:MAG: radical SAM protein [Patescibacteria group bacterium]
MVIGSAKRHLFRLIVPALSNFSIYSDIARYTTALGPICVATAANKLKDWDVEVIDENNCRGKFCPKDRFGLPDHPRLQAERPADAVGFYGSLSSTVPRIFELAEFYKGLGVRTIAGGKHVENLPEESLANGIDVVVLGEGEETIKELLLNVPLENIKGIAFRRNGQMIKTEPRPLITDFENQPIPDFNLIRYARISIYPVSRTRGCDMNCEFCAVKDKTRCATPEKMMSIISHLAETRGARKFFESSDHFAANREETMEFCRLLAEYQKRKGLKLKMTVQIRLNDARYPELLKAMKEAGIINVCIGYESPIDEELISMRKGYLSKDMINWTKIFHQYGFFIHGMFIFGYPRRNNNEPAVKISLDEKVKRFKNFINRAKIDTAQVLLTVPLVGTELRTRLEKEGRIFPLADIGWQYYDGQFPLFMPDDGVTPEEMQNAVTKIMSNFYRFHHLLAIMIHIVVHFPIFVFPAALTITTLKTRYITRVYNWWEKKYFRNQSMRFGGWFIVRNWFKNFRKDNFLEKLNQAKAKLNQAKEKLSRPAN